MQLRIPKPPPGSEPGADELPRWSVRESGWLTDPELVAGLRAREVRAQAAFHDRYAQPVLRILMRILGPDPELYDLHHDVFLRALSSIGELRDPIALRSWMSAIAVHTAKASIERRVRARRWQFLARERVYESPDPIDARARLDAREALRAVYRLLDRMPVAERIPFALRHVDQMELAEIAAACQLSLSSIKRRLSSGEVRFSKLARGTPELVGYFREGGSPWSQD